MYSITINYRELIIVADSGRLGPPIPVIIICGNISSTQPFALLQPPILKILDPPLNWIVCYQCVILMSSQNLMAVLL